MNVQRVFKSLHEHPLFKMRQEMEQSSMNSSSNGSQEALSFKALILSKRQASPKETQHQHTKKVTFSPGVETIEVSQFFPQETPLPFPMPKPSNLMAKTNDLNSTESLNNSSSSSGVTNQLNSSNDLSSMGSFHDLLHRNEVHFKSLKVLKEVSRFYLKLFD